MILTLLITILIESSFVVGFALWRKKPLVHLLLSSTFANVLTQFVLWSALKIFLYHYMAALLIIEVCIVGIEGFILYFYRPNRLKPVEAMVLSLAMNLASFGIGWFLPL